MVFVEGDIFMMGDDENKMAKSIKKIAISSFEIGKYPITQKQWQEIMGDNPSHFENCLDCPIDMVSWNDCQEFLKKLNAKHPRMNYRLPSEAEWEYAARGGNLSKGFTYSGSNDMNEVSWNSVNSNEKSHSVGKKNPNELDIHDMSGNVWEWCQDLDTADFRIVRGGSWSSNIRSLQNSSRHSYSCRYRNDRIGFRLTRNLH